MDGIYNSLQMEEITDQYNPAEMEQQKGLAIVAYLLPFLFFIPAVSNNDALYAKTVANQSLTNCAALILISILRAILANIPFIGGIFSFVLGILVFVIWVLIILKIVDAVNGKMRKMPFGFEISAFK